MPIKILQITNKPAYPAIDGGCLGMAKMSGFYDSNEKYLIDILTIETQKHKFFKLEFGKNLSSKPQITSVFMDTKPTFFGVLNYFFGKKSYNLARFSTKEFGDKILELVSENKYDIIQFENIFVGQYYSIIRKNCAAKLVLNSANVEYEIWERLAKKSSVLKRIYFTKLAKQLKEEEINIWQNMDGIISATEKDKITIEKKIHSEVSIVSIPFYLNISDYKCFYKKEVSKVLFFHIGAMDWLPNIEGVDWLVKNVWKSTFEKGKNSLHLAGKSMPNSIKQFASNSIKIDGFVEDAKQYISQNDVMLVPLFSGSGIRVKIVEAMALGKCIISTSVGAEGINCEDNMSILIANSKEEFIEKMNYLIQNPDRINEIGKNARKLVEKEHDISLMGSKLHILFDSIK